MGALPSLPTAPAQAQPRPGRIQITGRRWSDVALPGCAHHNDSASEGKRANKRARHANNSFFCGSSLAVLGLGKPYVAQQTTTIDRGI